MRRLTVTAALAGYDHVRDLATGDVSPQGADLLVLSYPIEEMFERFLRLREWHISEMSLAKYCALRSQGDTSMVGLPVFPLRAFRHSAMYVRGDSPLSNPSQLAGRTVGVPEWAQTAGVYVRGLLTHEYGVAVHDVTWVQAGVNQPGRLEKVRVALPAGVRCSSMPESSLNDLLLAGAIDAVFAAHPPDGTGDGSIRPLLADRRAEEAAYWSRTGIFPIMHLVVVRDDVVADHPWLPLSLYRAFDEAKRRSAARMLDTVVPRFPSPWVADAARDVVAEHGDPWPYGIHPNRPTLEAFLSYSWEQGLLATPLTPDDLFPADTADGYRV
ncbi:MAG: putative 4,5-dihydroxyphthalate decarboxylase [Frankiales bacterium]|nr:putative 4,5-dihydroxyphthalate decarboxylase [Frankiales bacterium]